MTDFQWAIFAISIVSYALGEVFRIAAMVFLGGIFAIILAFDNQGEFNFLLVMGVFGMIIIARSIQIFLSINRSSNDE